MDTRTAKITDENGTYEVYLNLHSEFLEILVIKFSDPHAFSLEKITNFIGKYGGMTQLANQNWNNTFTECTLILQNGSKLKIEYQP